MMLADSFVTDDVEDDLFEDVDEGDALEFDLAPDFEDDEDEEDEDGDDGWAWSEWSDPFPAVRSVLAPELQDLAPHEIERLLASMGLDAEDVEFNLGKAFTSIGKAAVPARTSRRTRSGYRRAITCAAIPPIENPKRSTSSYPSSSSVPTISLARSSISNAPRIRSDFPWFL